MRIILFTDAHYAADLPPQGGRMYGEGLDRLRHISRVLGPADAFINLGDLVNDAGDPAANRKNADAALQALRELGAPCISLAQARVHRPCRWRMVLRNGRAGVADAGLLLYQRRHELSRVQL